jgi:hypothetical protein
LPSTYEFHDGVITIHPHMVHFPPAATIAFLLVAHAVIITGGILFVWKMRTQLDDVQHRQRLHAWQLAQLLPAVSEEVHETSRADRP